MKVLIDAEKALHRAINDELGKIDAAYDIELMALRSKLATCHDLLLQVMQTAGGLLDTKLHDRIAEALRASGICGDEEPLETPEQWAARIGGGGRPEPHPPQGYIPDWSKVPDAYTYWAADFDGEAYFYASSPELNINKTVWRSNERRPCIRDRAFRADLHPDIVANYKTSVIKRDESDDDKLLTLDECEQLGRYAKAAGFVDVVINTIGGAGLPAYMERLRLDGHEYHYPTRKLLRGLKELAEERESSVTITGLPQSIQILGRIKRLPAPKPPLGGLTGDFDKMHLAVKAAATAGAQAPAKRKGATTAMLQALRMAHYALADTTPVGTGRDDAFHAVKEALELAEADGLS